MNRVLAIVLLVVILLLSGLWSAQREAPPDVAEASAARVEAEVSGEAGFVRLAPRSREPRRVFDAPEPVLREGVDYHAELHTSRGTIRVDLFEARAPRTVNNFVFLALHRYYDGVAFHRVLDGFMAQTGDPTGTGTGGPGYTFEDEIHPELLHDRRGVLSMANAGPDSNGSQFFITFAPAPWLDGRHTVFGAVVEGDEVLTRLTRVDPEAPEVVAHLDAPLARLAAQGVDVPDDAERTLEAYLREQLGALPVQGQSFQLAGRRGVLGAAEGRRAVGFYPVPDVVESVTILAHGPGVAGEAVGGTGSADEAPAELEGEEGEAP